MQEETTEKIYSSLDYVWPEENRWYNYTHKCIVDFVMKSLSDRLNYESVYLNAGSGGSVYSLPGTCFHVDIAENLIKALPHHVVASIEKMPFSNCSFDASICVGSVINYCDIVKSISELVRCLKPGGFLVLEYERSNTGELWFTKDYGMGATVQHYKYLGHIHTLWLYSEHIVNKILKENSFMVLQRKRFHCLSAIANRISDNEEASGRFGRFDPLLKPFSYISAHNIILLCQKSTL